MLWPVRVAVESQPAGGMMTEFRGPGSSPIGGGAVGEYDPAKSPPRPPSDPPRRSKDETPESDSESALEKTGRGRKRKPRDWDSAGSGSDSSVYSSPLREPKPPLVPICTERDGTVLYGFTDDQAAVNKYYADFRKYEEKSGKSLPSL